MCLRIPRLIDSLNSIGRHFDCHLRLHNWRWESNAPPFPPCCIWSYFGDLVGLFQSVQQAWQANEIKTPLKLIHRSANKLAHVTSHSRSLSTSTSLPPSLPISLSLRSAGKAHSEKPQMRKMQIVCLPACLPATLPPSHAFPDEAWNFVGGFEHDTARC